MIRRDDRILVVHSVTGEICAPVFIYYNANSRTVLLCAGFRRHTLGVPAFRVAAVSYHEIKADLQIPSGHIPCALNPVYC